MASSERKDDALETSSSLPEDRGARTEAVIIVDPISTGLDLAIELRKQGMNLVRIFSRSFPASVVSHLQGSEALDWTSTIQHQDDDLERTLKLLRNLKLSFQACVPGCETGVRCADALAERLGLPGNGALTSDIRRNKYLMGEQLRRSGLRAAKQALVQDWTDVETFLETEGYGEEFQLIVKPLDSAASDGVNLCHSRAELRQSVEELLGELNALGTLNSGILVQEYLGGRELVVDSVSREGVHKIVALWEYEKHPANGKPFIYHSMRLLCSERDPDAADVCEYALRVLEALHVKQGPAHTEIKLTPHGPVLVELGARLHGGDGSFLPIPRICLGYTQVSATVAALLRPDDFLQLPDRPVLGDSTGAEVFLIVRQAGIVRDLPLLPKLRRELQSLVQENFTVTPGSRVSVTVDAMTVPGGIAIVTESPETLEREISKARQILDDPDFILLEEGLDVESELSLPSIAAPAAITNSSVHRSHPRQDSPPVQSSFSAKSLPGLETAIRSLRESGSTVDLGSVRRTLHTEAATPKGIVVVDPFSSGANLAAELSSRGVPVIQLHSARFSERIQDMVREDLDLEFVACLQHEGPPRDPEAIQRTLKLLQNLPLEIQAVIPGCETGVEVADALAAALQVRGNDPGLSEARRDKFCMGEQVRRHGLRAVRQARATRWTHVQAFLEELRGRGKQNGQNPLFSFPETAGMKNKTTQGSWGHGFRAVIKPVSSGGSDGVYLCTSEEELRTRFDQLLGEINMLGQRNKSLLVQEYLEGPEFVVDTVSKDGKHKCVAVWAYDKRPANGAEFVYFSMRLQEMTPQVRRIVDYMFSVLDALGISNGPAHGEVKWTAGNGVDEEGPCLVEVGARIHGGEGSWCPGAEAALGYTVVSATCDLLLESSKFDEIPKFPESLKTNVTEVYFVTEKSGILSLFNEIGLQTIRELPSFLRMDLFLKPGQELRPTVDCATMPGSVLLANEDSVQLARDILQIREVEKELFLLEAEVTESLSSSPSLSAHSEPSENAAARTAATGGTDQEEDDGIFELEWNECLLLPAMTANF